MKFKKNITILSLVAVSLAPLSQSAWVTFYDGKVKSYSKTVSTDVTKVAYTISDSKVITYYLTIESALEHTTSGTIYVIPGSNPKITRDCEIKSGVTLCIPYDDNGDGTHSDFTNLQNQSDNGFADKDAAAVAKNRKNLITIASGITLTNNGTLDVAGKVGVGSESNQRPSGFTLGDYCEILMESNAKIQNNGSINLYGYIKESSKNNGSSVVNSSTGSMKMPFTIYDYRGGSYSGACFYKNVMPFSYFDFPNCHANQAFEYGSKLTGVALLFALSSYYSSEIVAISKETDDCLFKMSNGKINIKYNPSSFGYTTADVSNSTTSATANYTNVLIDGDVSLSSFKVSVGGSSFDSSEVECPISYKFQITQNSGTLTLPNKIKFLSGSSLTIADGASCVINSPVIFYQNYLMPSNSIGKVCPKNMGRAKLLVNGELTINSSFGGVINSENKANKVITGENFTESYQTYEITGNSSTDATQWDVHLEFAAGYQAVSDSISTFKLEKSKEYTIAGNYWSDVENDVTSFTFSPAFGRSVSKTAKNYTVKVITGYYEASSNVTVDYQWSYQEGPDSWNPNGNQVTFTTPAASSSSIDYKITCKVTYTWLSGDTSDFTFDGTYEAYYDPGCVLPTALVLMADGTYREAISLKTGDMVIAFNHETGNLEPTRILLNDHVDDDGPAEMYDVLHLEFDNGKSTDLIYEHGYFDLDENKYVYLRLDNYSDYIGHRFVFVDNKLNRFTLKLEKVTVEKMLTKLAAPVTAHHLNVIVDGILGIEGTIRGLFNIFEYDPETLAFDKEKMQRDIDKYGLLDYECFKDYFPKKIYDLLPCKYLGVSIGKGLITWDIIKSHISKWKDQLMQNMM